MLRDVVVVGAGPAGLMAARAARAARPRRRRARRARRHRRSRPTAPAFSASTRSTSSTFRATPSSSTAHAARFVAPTAARCSSTPSASAPRSSIARCSIRRSPTRAARPAPSCAAARACASIAITDAGVDGRGGRRRRARSTARACVLACGANYRFNRAARPRRAARVRPERAARAAVRGPGPRRSPPRPRRWRRADSPGSCRSARDGQPYQRLGLMADARAARSSAHFAARMRAPLRRSAMRVARAAAQDPAARSGRQNLRRPRCSPSATPPGSSSRRPAAASTTA